MRSQAVSAVIAAARGLSVGEVGQAQASPPAKPITADELAELQGFDNRAEIGVAMALLPEIRAEL